MMHRALESKAPTLLLVAICLVAGIPARTRACCVASPPDQTVRIADQEVLIIWDAATGTEHFIRRANFRSGRTTESFGFLVPTPTEPKLGESPDEVFDRLGKLTAPREVNQFHFRWSLYRALFPVSTKQSIGASAAAHVVRVVSRAHVAGYDAVVLEADDPGALSAWFGEHGFDSRPEIADWARPYVEAGWMITAFTFNPQAEESESGAVSTPSVRMTFAADHPVFPYRVPSDNREGRGLLRLFYVGDERVSAQLGPSRWRAGTAFAQELGRPLGKALSGALPKSESFAGSHWLTVFEDWTWPSGQDDLYFGRAASQESISSSPYIHDRNILVPLDAIFLFGIPALVLKNRRRNPR